MHIYYLGIILNLSYICYIYIYVHILKLCEGFGKLFHIL